MLPIPKSSMATRMPSAPSRSSTGTTRDGSATSAVSVISTSSRSGGTACSSSSDSMRSTTATVVTSCAERFTATGVARPSARHAASCVTHSVSAYRVTSWMRPDCSASGMNVVGGSTPRVGCTQRMRASSPTVRPVASSILGW